MKILSFLILALSLISGGRIWQSSDLRAQADLPLPQIATVESEAPISDTVPTLRPEEFQAEMLKWFGVATVAAGSLAAFVTYVLGKLYEVKRVLTQQDSRLNTQALKIHQTAIAVAPTSVIPPESRKPSPEPDSSAAKAIGLLMVAAMLAPGCTRAQVQDQLSNTDVTASATYGGVTVTGGRINGRNAVAVGLDGKEIVHTLNR